MSRFDFNKYIDEREYKTFTFNRNNKEFIIAFSGALDLHFMLQNFGDKPYFIIDKDNYIIYELFDKLYNEIKNCNIYGNVMLEPKDRYELLFKDDIIEWRCDDFPYDIAPYFNIIKEEDYYIIRFNQCIYDDKIDWQYPFISDNIISVRIRNSGSRYHPFNISFMKLYNSLCNLEQIDIEQVHIEEYLFDKKRKLLK